MRAVAAGPEVARFFDGLELVEPGWCRCTSGEPGVTDPAAPSSGYAVVGRKP